MPVVQPGELWQESGRWSQYGPELLRFKDRHERDFVLGPTHEEVITDIARRELQELPPAAGQFLPDPDQVPRRGAAALRRHARARVHHEGRLLLPPRRGLAAGRLPRHVRRLHAHLHPHRAHLPRRARRLRRHRRQTSARSFTCSPLPARTRSCSRTGTTTPRTSRPPRRCRRPSRARPPRETLRKVATPGVRTIEDLARLLKVEPARCLKTLIVDGTGDEVVALVVRGDHELNAVKAQKLPGVASPLRMASAARVLAATGTEPGYVGPGRPQVPRVRRPRGARARGLRLRRQREGHAPDRASTGGAICRPRRPRTCARWSRAIRAPRAAAA